MDVRVSGIHMDVGESVVEYIEQKLADLSKYPVNIVDVQVNLHKDQHKTVAEIGTAGQGLRLRAQGENDDAYAAFDSALAKLESQLSKYKGRMQKYGRRTKDNMEKLNEVAAFRMTQQLVNEESLEDAPEEMFSDFLPKVEHKDVRNVSVMTVDDAVMQMDLLHVNFFMFVNAQTGGLNLVYREEEGETIGWIEVDQIAAEAKTA